MFCCECGSEMRFTSEPVTETFHGESFTVDGIERHVCDACGNDVMSADMATKLAAELARMYAEKTGMLAPGEIRDIRKKLGLTQTEFEKLVGVSSPTACRWERGSSLQSKSADLLLRLIRDVPDAARYLEREAGIPERSGSQAHLSVGTGSVGSLYQGNRDYTPSARSTVVERSFAA